MKDFNGDGKQDWKDEAFLYGIIHNKEKEEEKPNKKPTNNSIQISGLGKVVLVILTIVCLYFLFNGAGEHIGTLLGFGLIAFLIAQWLDS